MEKDEIQIIKHETTGKKKRGFHLTMFAAIVLVILLCAILGIGVEEKNPLFEKGVQTTLYAQTEIGLKLQLDAKDYWTETDFDIQKVTFDMAACDWNREGIYEVPVLYEGKPTNCVVKVEVKSSGNPLPSSTGEEDAKLMNPEPQ